MLLYIIVIVVGIIVGIVICKYLIKSEKYDRRKRLYRNKNREEENKLYKQRLLRKRLEENDGDFGY